MALHRLLHLPWRVMAHLEVTNSWSIWAFDCEPNSNNDNNNNNATTTTTTSNNNTNDNDNDNTCVI